MGRTDDAFSDEPPQRDVVEFGRPDEGGWLARRWRRWLPLVVVIAAAVAVAVHATGVAGPSASPTPVSPTLAVPSPPAPIGTAEPTVTVPAVTDIGHPILGITDGWELFGRGPGGIVRIEFAAGRVTRTAVPPLSSTGPVWLVVGDGWAIVRPLDSVAGYLVTDGQPAQPLTGLLDDGGLAFAGPDGNSVWVSPDVRPVTMTLARVDGRAAGPSMTMPKGTDGVAMPDGTGYAVVGSSGGAYLARPDGARRITTGSLVALGPSTWLVQDCADLRRCPMVVIDRATGRRHVLSGTVLAADTSGAGLISPDGAFAAIRMTGSIDSGRADSVHLIDLNSGADRRLDVPLGAVPDIGAMVWSPRSRWLFIVGDGGRLSALDPSTGRATSLGIGMPPLDQLAVRSADR